MKKQHLYALLIFATAVLLRVAFIPNPGFEADVSFWKGWGLAAADKGVVWSILNTNNNYPTPFAYTLGAMTTIYRLLGGDPHNFNEYWTNTNLRFLIASKIFPIMADFGIALLFLWIGSRFGSLFKSSDVRSTDTETKNNTSRFQLLHSNVRLPLIGKIPTLFGLLATMYLLNPVTIMDGAWWGQVDSLGVIVFLLAFVALLYKKPFLAGFIFMASMMTKLQNMIYGPLFFVLIWQQFGFTGMLQAVAGAITGFFGLNIEFLSAKQMSRVVGSLSNNYDYFPWMSLHAYNIWWIMSGGKGMQMSDKIMTIGIATAHKVGTILFSTTYLLALLQLVLPVLQRMIQPWKTRSQEALSENGLTSTSILHFFLGLVIINAGFFLFQTQSHERYAFPAMVFLLFLIPYLEGKRRKIFLAVYCLLSVLYFYNLHTAFGVNYPDDVFPFLKGFFLTAGPTMTVAAIFNIIFLGFLGFYRKELKIIPLAASAGFFVMMLIAANGKYILKQPMYLSDLAPTATFQGFGQRMKDMPVNASYGVKSWAWLSDQYVFYHHGIGTHAVSEIRYDIGRRFSTLTTDYGIDTEAGTGASATFEIWGDGKQLFSSPMMGRFDMPKYAKVDISGVKQLVLITRDGGDGNRDDHTDWLNTKLYP